MADDEVALPWFPFFVNDWIGSMTIEMMDAAQVGSYVSLLARSWNASPAAHLPNNPQLLQRWSKMTPEEWRAKQELVMRCFTPTPCGKYLFNPKLLAVWENQMESHAKKSAAAKVRWDKYRATRAAQTSLAPPPQLDRSVPTEIPQESATVEPPTDANASGKRGGGGKIFSEDVERLYATGCELFAEAGHRTPTTPKQIEAAKDPLRLMLDRDGLTRAEVEAGMAFVNADTGNGKWPGWRAVCQSFSSLREKWPKIAAQIRPPEESPYPSVEETERRAERYAREERGEA